MKRLLIFLFLCGSIYLSHSQKINPEYDPDLSSSLGADDYGMKKYVFVILKTGQVEVSDKALRDSLFAGHMQNISLLADMGKLLVAGPFFPNDKAYRGLFILNVDNLDEARELVSTDPVIKEGIMNVDLFEWYGSAALGEYMKIHRKIGKYIP